MLKTEKDKVTFISYLYALYIFVQVICLLDDVSLKKGCIESISLLRYLWGGEWLPTGGGVLRGGGVEECLHRSHVDAVLSNT